MNIDPTLTTLPRVANGAMGAGLLAFAVLGSFDHTWVRVFVAVFGVVFVVGAIGGT